MAEKLNTSNKRAGGTETRVVCTTCLATFADARLLGNYSAENDGWKCSDFFAWIPTAEASTINKLQCCMNVGGP